MISKLETKLLDQLSGLDTIFPAPISEYKFHPIRKWRFDFAWPDYKLAVEVEGGTWSQGRHTTGSGHMKDCDKYNQAAMLGWCVLRFTSNHINDGSALLLLNEFFNK